MCILINIVYCDLLYSMYEHTIHTQKLKLTILI